MKDYIYEDARIRLRENDLLSGNDYEQLLAEPDYASALTFLRDKGWGDPSVAQSGEEMLRSEEKKAWDLMEELIPGSTLLDTLRLSRDYHNLKAAIKQFYTDSPLSPERLYQEGGTLPLALIRRAVEEQDFDPLPEAMQGAAREATEVLARTGDGQLCDIILDKAALEALLKAGEKAPDPVLREYAQVRVAAANIRTALRGAAGGRNLEEIQAMLVDMPELSSHALAESALGGRQAVADYLSTGAFWVLSEALRRSMSAFECACDNLLIERIRPQRNESEKPGPLAAYVIARECEIKSVRLLLSGKLNHLPEALLRENIRDSYA